VSFLTIDLLFSRRQVPFSGDSADAVAAVLVVLCLQAAKTIALSAINGRSFIVYELGLKNEKYFSSLTNIIFIFAIPTASRNMYTAAVRLRF
jgi:hypothetical protein